MIEPRPLDLRALVTALERHRVRFVVIGGVAAQAHGSPSMTYDLDVCVARDRENAAALAAALRDMHAYPRAAPAGLPFQLDAQALLSRDLSTWATDFGDLDTLGEPTPGLRYEDLVANATMETIAGQRVLVAGLDDLIAMKRAAGRPKDRIELEVLGALREEIDRGG